MADNFLESQISLQLPLKYDVEIYQQLIKISLVGRSYVLWVPRKSI